LELQQYHDAKASHERAIQIDPQLTASYYSLARVCARLGDQEASRRYREQFAVRKQADMQEERESSRQYSDVAAQRDMAAGAHRSCGDVQVSFGDHRKAEAHWLRGASIAPESVQCREALATLFEKQNRWRAAAEVLGELTVIDPEDADFWYRTGTANVRVESFEQAETAFRRAMELDTSRGEACLALVKLHLQGSRKLPDVLPLAEAAAARAGSARAYVMLSAVRDEQGDSQGALLALKEATRLEPENAELRRTYKDFQAGKR
jgi:tetratricopeptide (TPR) repeat protein